MDQPDLAPGVAIVGAANAGKSSLTQALNGALEGHPSRPQFYIARGSPDGTGLYLACSPGLREVVKPRVKHGWTDAFVGQCVDRIAAARAETGLLLCDIGGRRDPRNQQLLAACTHFIVVSRASAEASDARAWIDDCLQAGLRPLARLRSMAAADGTASPTAPAADGALEGVFRVDLPPAEIARGLAPLVDSLVAMARPRQAPEGIDLGRLSRWRVEDLHDLAGMRPALERAAARGELVTLGGKTALWVYAAALHCVLDVNPDIEIEVQNIGTRARIRVPRTQEDGAPGPLAQDIEVWWQRHEHGATLNVRTRQGLIGHWDELARLPKPADPEPPGLLVLSVYPNWLHLACSRWLRRVAPGAAIGAWDAGLAGAVILTGPSAPYLMAWPVPQNTPEPRA